MRHTLALLLLLLASPGQAATCDGQDLIAALPANQCAALQAKADVQPLAHGNLWTATKYGHHISLAFTYHGLKSFAKPGRAGWLTPLSPVRVYCVTQAFCG